MKIKLTAKQIIQVIRTGKMTLTPQQKRKVLLASPTADPKDFAQGGVVGNTPKSHWEKEMEHSSPESPKIDITKAEKINKTKLTKLKKDKTLVSKDLETYKQELSALKKTSDAYNEAFKEYKDTYDKYVQDMAAYNNYAADLQTYKNTSSLVVGGKPPQECTYGNTVYTTLHKIVNDDKGTHVEFVGELVDANYDGCRHQWELVYDNNKELIFQCTQCGDTINAQ